MKKAIATTGILPSSGVCSGTTTRREALSLTARAAVGLGALSPLALFSQHAEAQNLGRFPTVDAENIRGESLKLPRDLPGRLLLVSLALSPRRQRDMVAWADQLSALASTRREVAFYEIVVAGRRGALERFLIDKNISSATPDDDARLRTFTVYEAEAVFRRAMKLPSQDVYVFVMTSSGLILQRTNGRVTQDKVLTLRRSIDQAIQGGRYSQVVL
ncbi:MAG: hypothetical protein ACFB6R_04840 [Alphaproteobacteria bacterium]